MNCREFRERCHVLVDARITVLTDDAMLAHEHSCPECAEFFRGLVAVDEDLRRIPLVPISPPLVNSLREIGRPVDHPPASWGPDVARAARYLLPGLLLWGAQWAVPESARSYLLAAITFIGVFTFATSVLRSRILGSSHR